MANERRIARWAAPVYLVVVVAGFFSQGCVPGKMVAPGDPQAMLANIVLHEVLFRAGAAAFMMEHVVFLLLPFLLFRWLLTAHRGAARWLWCCWPWSVCRSRCWQRPIGWMHCGF